MARAFSGIPPLKMDFSEKVNTNEIKLKDPNNLKKLNICQAVTNALDTALSSDPKYLYLSIIALMSLAKMSSSAVSSDVPLVSTLNLVQTEYLILLYQSKELLGFQ